MRLFISYRTEDSPAITGRIRDRLVEKFGARNVYYYVDSNIPGKDFREQIDSGVRSCDALVVVIGAGWLGIKDGRRRIDEPGDYVRLEVEAALQRDIPVVPTLVNGVRVPAAKDLPESIRSLAFRHGLPVRQDPDFHGDMTRLITSLTGGNTPWWRRHRKPALLVGGTVSVAGLVIWLTLPWTGDTNGPTPPTTSTVSPTTGPTGAPLPITERTFAVMGEVSTAADPRGVEADGDNLLVSFGSGMVQRVDPKTNEIKASVAFGYPGGLDLVFNPDELAVTLFDDERLGFVDTEFGASEVVEIGGGHPLNGAVAADGFWFTCQTDESGFLSHVADRREVERIPVNFYPSGLWVEGDELYVTASGEGLVARVDARTGAVQTVDVGNLPVDLAIIGGDLWVTLAESDEIVVLDPAGLTVKKRHSVGDRPWKLVFGLGSVWTTNSPESPDTPGSVSRLDPVTGQRQQPDIVVGATPDQIAVGPDAVFVQSRGHVTILKAAAE